MVPDIHGYDGTSTRGYQNAICQINVEKRLYIRNKRKKGGKMSIQMRKIINNIWKQSKINCFYSLLITLPLGLII